MPVRSATTSWPSSPERRLWLAILAVAFGTNVPTPLLLAYQDRLDLSATTLTVVFALYAVGLVPALLLAGPASDRRGRRPVLVPFVWLSALASLLLVGAGASLPLLSAGRLLQGAVSGVVFSIGSAWLGELVGDPGRASRRVAAAMSLGFGAGPVVAGVLGQWGPAPTVSPYVVHLLMMGLAVWAVRDVPETVGRRAGGPWVRLGVPPSARRAFATFVVPTALLVFVFPSVSVTVLPLALRSHLPGLDLATTGLVAGVTLTTGMLVQPLERRLGAVRAAPAAALAGATGLAAGILAARHGQPWLLLVAAVLSGAAYGLALASGLTVTQRLATPDARGSLTATFYTIAYLGFAAPVLVSATSTGSGFDGPLVVLTVLAVVVSALLRLGPGPRAVSATAAFPEASAVVAARRAP